MTVDKGWLERVRGSRIGGVLLVYLGVSWLIFEVATTLQQGLGLPPWVSPAVFLLLAAGLVVVLATAWVQSHPQTKPRAEREEVPSAWEVEPAGVVADLRRGRLPHLTWGRAAAGGMVAFCLLAVTAGVWALLRATDPAMQDPRAGSSDSGAALAVAVLPFDVVGVDSLWSVAMVRLLSTNIDGIAGVRAIDANTVLARRDELRTATGLRDLAFDLRVGAATDARWTVRGSLIADGSRISAVAQVYASMGDGRSLGQARMEGVADSLHSLADRLSFEVLRRILESEDGPVIQPSDLSRPLSASIEAIRAYLEGEEHLRTADWAGAQEDFRRAVEADSAFALAWAKLALAIEWTNPESGADRYLPYVERALALGDRLPSRDRLLLKAIYDRSRALPSATDSLEAGVGRWPDDPDLWYQLGEAYLHIRHPAYPSLEMAEHAFTQAVQLDPGSLPYQLHYLEFAFTRPDDVDELQERMDLFRRTLRSEPPEDGSLTFAPRRATLWIPMALGAGTPAERDSARRVLRADPALLASAGFMTSGHPRTMSEVYELTPLLAAERLITPHVRDQYRLSIGIHLGRLRDVHALRHLVEVPPPRHWECGIQSANSLGVVLPDEWVAEVLSPNPDEEAEEAEVTVCRGLLAAARDDNATYQSAIRRLRDAATAEGDSLAAAELRDLALGLEATRPAELGEEEAVATLYTTAWRSPSLTKRLGETYLQLGRPQDARRILAYQPIDPHQRYRLGQALERIGKFAEAIVAYSFALEAWESADPEWQPMARDVRAVIATLQAEID